MKTLILAITALSPLFAQASSQGFYFCFDQKSSAVAKLDYAYDFLYGRNEGDLVASKGEKKCFGISVPIKNLSLKVSQQGDSGWEMTKCPQVQIEDTAKKATNKITYYLDSDSTCKAIEE